jgi:hypothetical protein
MKAKSAILILCASIGSVCAKPSLIPASPGVERDFKSEYGGDTLKAALLNAGAPIEATDTVRYESKSISLAVEADKNTVEYIRALVSEFYSRTPVQRDKGEIAHGLIGRTADLGNVKFHGDEQFGAIRFEGDHIAVGLNRKGAQSADLRWAVSIKGDIYVRHSDGRLLLTGNLNAPGNLVFTVPKQAKAYDITLQPR